MAAPSHYPNDEQQVLQRHYLRLTTLLENLPEKQSFGRSLLRRESAISFDSERPLHSPLHTHLMGSDSNIPIGTPTDMKPDLHRGWDIGDHPPPLSPGPSPANSPLPTRENSSSSIGDGTDENTAEFLRYVWAHPECTLLLSTYKMALFLTKHIAPSRVLLAPDPVAAMDADMADALGRYIHRLADYTRVPNDRCKLYWRMIRLAMNATWADAPTEYGGREPRATLRKLIYWTAEYAKTCRYVFRSAAPLDDILDGIPFVYEKGILVYYILMYFHTKKQIPIATKLDWGEFIVAHLGLWRGRPGIDRRTWSDYALVILEYYFKRETAIVVDASHPDLAADIYHLTSLVREHRARDSLVSRSNECKVLIADRPPPPLHKPPPPPITSIREGHDGE